MNLIVRIVAATLAIAAFSIRTTVLADSPNAGGAVMRSTTSQATAHFVTIDLTWTGTGRLLTTPLAPGQAANGGSGFHITTPFANVTLNGVVSARAATVFGSIDVPGFTFPISSLQSDLTFLSAGSDNFIVTLKP